MNPPILALVLASALPGITSAAVINIDFNAGTAPLTQTGLAAAPDAAGDSAYWNSVARDGTKTRVGVVPLLDSTGGASTVTLHLDISGGFDSLGAGDQEIGGTGQAYLGLMSDYVFIDAAVAGVISTKDGNLSGLEPLGYYDLYFYGQGNHFTGNVYRGQNTLFTVDGVSQQTSWDGVHGGNGSLDEGVEYVKFTAQADGTGRINFSWANVVAGPGGNVAVDADGSSTRYAAFNGLQIVPNLAVVPEPSSLLLGGLGMLAFLRRRR